MTPATHKGFFARFLRTRAIHRLFRRMAMLESLAGAPISREVPAALGQTLSAAARSAEAIRKKPGRTEYQRGTVGTAPDGTLLVRTTGNQGSGVLSSMVRGNGLIVLHHAQGHVAAGDEVDVMMFDGAI